MKNNHATVSLGDTATLISQVSEPLFTGQLAHLTTKGLIMAVLLDLSRSHDLELYKRLYNSGDFEVLSETEHSGRYSVFAVIRYRQLKEAPLGQSSSERYTKESDADRVEERKLKKAERAAKKKIATTVKKIVEKKAKPAAKKKVKARPGKRGSIGFRSK